MNANEKQVGGNHYKGKAVEHWDIVAQHELDYFQGQITKYVMRWKKKNGIQDLEKARHFLDKYIELVKLSEVIAAAEDNPFKGKVTLTPIVAAFGTERSPTGWVGFVYEGGNAIIDFYRCRTCRVHFSVKRNDDPNETHECDAGQPDKSYVNQD